MPKAGDKAPAFTLLNQDEKEVKLADFKGKWVVLYFYPKDNTSGCTIEAIDFTESNPDFEGMDAVVLGVSPDSCKSHRGFIEMQNLGITLLADTEKTVLEAYDAWREKKNYGRTYMGVVRSTYLIDPDGKIAHVWDNVRAKGHAEKVKAKLAELRG